MALSVESAAEIAVFFIAIDVIRLNLRGHIDGVEDVLIQDVVAVDDPSGLQTERA